MSNGRYPEGSYLDGKEIPELVFTPVSIDDTSKIQYIRRNAYYVPISTALNVSLTSKAKDCFVDRQFSLKMQQFMLHYSYMLNSSKVLSGEI